MWELRATGAITSIHIVMSGQNYVTPTIPSTHPRKFGPTPDPLSPDHSYASVKYVIIMLHPTAPRTCCPIPVPLSPDYCHPYLEYVIIVIYVYFLQQVFILFIVHGVIYIYISYNTLNTYVLFFKMFTRKKKR